ncbi:MAG: DUF6884 domain-containing protein [Pyrobaculum sp.]
MYIVVTNCTKEKLNRPAPARELYRGPSVRNMARVVEEAREKGIDVWLYIISARYGLVREDEVLDPYDETLGGRPLPEIKKWAKEVRLLEKFRELEGVIFLVASKNYYHAVEEATCEKEVYVLSRFRPSCGKWIKTGNFDKHKVLKNLLYSESRHM